MGLSCRPSMDCEVYSFLLSTNTRGEQITDCYQWRRSGADLGQDNGREAILIIRRTFMMTSMMNQRAKSILES